MVNSLVTQLVQVGLISDGLVPLMALLALFLTPILVSSQSPEG